METRNWKVTITFTEPILGTVPKDAKIYEDYIMGENGQDDELETVPSGREGTGFHTIDGHPFLYDYLLKGFLKDACGMLRRCPGSLSSKITAYKRVIDGQVFIEPRRILLDLKGRELDSVRRPLRAQTAQGERVSLAISDAAPAGTSITFTLVVLGELGENLLREWLDYGHLRGMGQWRNGSYGRFTYEIEKAT